MNSLDQVIKQGIEDILKEERERIKKEIGRIFAIKGDTMRFDDICKVIDSE